MKKKFFLVSTLLVVAMSAMFVSCKKDEPTKGCSCSISYFGESYTEFIPLSDMSHYGVKTCSALAELMREEGAEDYGVKVSCSAE